MTTALSEPPGHTISVPAVRLRSFAAAMRLSFTWFGVRKSLTPQQKEQAAESFGAEGQYLSAGKKLIDTKHPAFKAVSSIRNRIVTSREQATSSRMLTGSDLSPVVGPFCDPFSKRSEAMAAEEA